MVLVSKTRNAIAVGLALLLGGGLGAGALAQEAPPSNAQPLSAVELHKLYRDKTWTWENGAVRFVDDGRRFLAWVNGEKGESYGEGRFTLSDSGRLCLRGKWTDTSGTQANTTCFLHRKAGGTIYQKRENDGTWYIFRHDPVRPGDEVNTLTADDTVSQPVDAIKRKFSG